MSHEQDEEEPNDQAHMFMSHYSTLGIAFYYLIRKYPSYLIQLQMDALGGPADRIFHSVNNSWKNGLDVLSDNKEMIPEFYIGDGSFLINSTGADLGSDHMSEQVSDVSLPDWATSPSDFVMKMRMALESNSVTMQLPKWIDLIFGHLQQG